MEFLKAASRRRSLLSETIYVALNVALAVALLILVRTIESPLPAFALVLLSKWRVFAVRPRYWFVNIQSNLVDLIVGLSVVIVLYMAGGALVAQVVVVLLYIAWLLVVKPRSKRSWIVVQAGAATFLGIAALSMVSSDWSAFIVVVLSWVVGYAGARHILASADHTHTMFTSLLWALVVAEIAWLTYHWNFAYVLPGLGKLMLPQNAIIVLVLGFLSIRVYTSYHKNGEIKSGEVVLPALLAVSIILLLVTVFNQFGTALS